MGNEDKVLMLGSSILIVSGTFFFSGVVASGLMTGILGFISAAFLLIKIKTYVPRLWGAIVIPIAKINSGFSPNL